MKTYLDATDWWYGVAHRFCHHILSTILNRIQSIRGTLTTPDEMRINDKILTTCIKTIKMKVDSKSEIVLFKASWTIYIWIIARKVDSIRHNATHAFIISITPKYSAMHLDTHSSSEYSQILLRGIEFYFNGTGRNV